MPNGLSYDLSTWRVDLFLKIHYIILMLKNVHCELCVVRRVVYKGPKRNHPNLILTAFIFHGLLPFPTRPPLSPLSPQNMLDHDSAVIRP